MKEKIDQGIAKIGYSKEVRKKRALEDIKYPEIIQRHICMIPDRVYQTENTQKYTSGKEIVYKEKGGDDI